MIKVQSEKIMEISEAPLLEASTDVTLRSAKWESKVNADH